MRGSISAVLLGAAVAALALPISAQVTRGGATTATTAPFSRAARQPYTASYKITRVRTLANGSTITQESTEVIALDSSGRHLTSTTNIPASENKTPTTHTSIFDPAARTTTTWLVPGKQVTVMSLPTPGAARSCASNPMSTAPVSAVAPAVAQRPRPTVEDLGVKSIQGVQARGRLTSITTPAGAIGNDAPLVRTTELWTTTTPGLMGLTVREVTDDPQTGNTTKELENLSPGEPDAFLFQPPEGYEIVTREMATLACVSVEGTEPSTAPIPPPPPPQ